MKKSMFLALSMVGLCILVSGCTLPQYSRTVERKYDANGKLVETVIKEYVFQPDTNTKSLLPVLKNQTYQK
ncbi:MAG: hypothetical protein WC047_04985 [Kiritimatiellales bacterium]